MTLLYDNLFGGINIKYNFYANWVNLSFKRKPYCRFNAFIVRVSNEKKKRFKSHVALLLHGPSMFAVKAKIYGVLYNQASSIAFDETSSYWSALKSS